VAEPKGLVHSQIFEVAAKSLDARGNAAYEIRAFVAFDAPATFAACRDHGRFNGKANFSKFQIGEYIL
jgi:hypothetical protein